MTYLHFYCIFVNGALYLHFFKGLLHVLNRIGYQHHILFFYHERSTMLYNNIIKNRKVYVAWNHCHVGLKQWALALLLLFFDFRVRLREHFRLFIVSAVYHEKITKQNKRASCKKNKKKKTEKPTLDEQGWWSFGIRKALSYSSWECLRLLTKQWWSKKV